jgi:RNA polymerase sigma factor (sigma-70 family)
LLKKGTLKKGTKAWSAQGGPAASGAPTNSFGFPVPSGAFSGITYRAAPAYPLTPCGGLAAAVQSTSLPGGIEEAYNRGRFSSTRRSTVEARPMPSEGSVTCLLAPAQAGDPAAVQRLWERYFRRLVGLARQWLHGAAPAGGDAEDVALSAFTSFWRNAERGRFPQLADRDGLWRLLVVITARKAAHVLRDEQHEPQAPGGEAAPDLERLLSREPTPELAAQLAERYRRLLEGLGDRDLESVAVWRMEGYTVEEIAARLGCVARTVKRKLGLIRGIWEGEVER